MRGYGGVQSVTRVALQPRGNRHFWTTFVAHNAACSRTILFLRLMKSRSTIGRGRKQGTIHRPSAPSKTNEKPSIGQICAAGLRGPVKFQKANVLWTLDVSREVRWKRLANKAGSRTELSCRTTQQPLRLPSFRGGSQPAMSAR